MHAQMRLSVLCSFADRDLAARMGPSLTSTYATPHPQRTRLALGSCALSSRPYVGGC
jgi:hypothetical protein